MITRSTAFKQLQYANPVLATDMPGVQAHTIGRLDEVIAMASAASFRTSVAPTRRLRLLTYAAVVAVIVAATVALVGSAFGIGVPSLRFFDAEKAPQRVVQDFESLTVGAPSGMDPEAIADESRRVATIDLADGKHILWVAPTRSGGFCYEWTHGGGSCDKLGTTPLGVGWLFGPGTPTGPNGLATLSPSAFSGIEGYASSRYIDRVEIRFADGTTNQLPLTWVSEPISAGFFLYEFSNRDRQPGHEVTAIVGLDANGDTVTEETPGGSGSLAGVPQDAISSEEHQVASIETTDGPAVIWEAPTRYDGNCMWFAFNGQTHQILHCAAHGYDWNDGITFRLYPTADTVVLVGTAADRYREFDLNYVDGYVQKVFPDGRSLLAELPKDHLTKGKQLETITVRGANGEEIPSARFVFTAGDQSPCSQRVLPLQPGDACD